MVEILITIYPQDHRYCGECPGWRKEGAKIFIPELQRNIKPDWKCYTTRHEDHGDWYKVIRERGSECVEAERKATALRVAADPESVLQPNVAVTGGVSPSGSLLG